MDVNRTQGIAPVGGNTGGNAGRDHPAKDHSDEPHDETANDPGAFEIDGLAAEITPAAQEVLNRLAAEIEPLRRQLEMSREREQNLREDLARHAYLPVPGRREFIRELNHVLNHLGDLAVMPSVASLHVANAEEVRRKFGRGTLDRYLIHVANAISRTLHPNDVLGSLGGSDFALILLGADASEARERMAGIVNSLSASPFRDQGRTISLKLLKGVAELSAGTTAEAALHYADRNLLANT